MILSSLSPLGRTVNPQLDNVEVDVDVDVDVDTIATTILRPEGSNLAIEQTTARAATTATIVPTTTTKDVNNRIVLKEEGICEIALIHSFTQSYGWEQAAAIALALHHLNTANTTRVPQLANLLTRREDEEEDTNNNNSTRTQRCPIHFSLQKVVPTRKLDQFRNSFTSIRTTETTGSNASNTNTNTNTNSAACAYIGAQSSALSIPTSAWTGIANRVQMSPTATSSQLDNRNWHPLFGKSTTSDASNALVYLKFFVNVLGIEHLTIVSNRDAYGSGLVQDVMEVLADTSTDRFQNINNNNNNSKSINTTNDDDEDVDELTTIFLSDHKLKIRQVSVVSTQNQVLLEQAVENIKDTIGFQFVWCLTDNTMILPLLQEARRQNFSGQWFFGDSFHTLYDDFIQRDVNGIITALDSDITAMATLLDGVGFLEPTGSNLDGFAELLQELNNPDDLDFLQDLLPSRTRTRSQNEGEGIETDELNKAADRRYLQSILEQGSSNVGSSVLAYQAAIAIGIGACQSVTENLRLDGVEHFDYMTQKLIFQDADQIFQMDPRIGARDVSTALFRVRNFQFQNRNIEDTTQIPVAITTHEYINGTWTALQDFTFQSGSTQIPSDLPPAQLEEEVIAPAVRGLMFALSALVTIQAIGCIVWTKRNRRTRVILASQPLFLHTISIGMLVFGTSMIPFVLDHGIVSSMDGLHSICVARIWLFTLGLAIALCAFLAKTHRVNRIMNNPQKFKRIRVTVKQVAIPMVICLIVCIILLTVMTIVAPPQYEFQVEGYDQYSRPNKIEGRCHFEEAAPFVITLGSILLFLMCWTVYEAYRARSLATEYSESKFIFKALLSTMAVSFVSIPLLFVTEDSPTALAFVICAVVFVTTTSMLYWTFVPKYFQLRASKKNSSQATKWTISGLQNVSNQNHPAAGNATSPLPFSVEPEEEGRTSSLSDDSSNFKGIKILTAKTKEQLLQENNSLEARVAELEELIERSENIEGLRLSVSERQISSLNI